MLSAAKRQESMHPGETTTYISHRQKTMHRISGPTVLAIRQLLKNDTMSRTRALTMPVHEKHWGRHLLGKCMCFCTLTASAPLPHVTVFEALFSLFVFFIEYCSVIIAILAVQ